jgi:hypothetical protein
VHAGEIGDWRQDHLIGNGLYEAEAVSISIRRTLPNADVLGVSELQGLALGQHLVLPEFYNDMEGQRTGATTRYVDFGIGWQRWFSPQIEIRPEVVYYHSFDARAFNGNFNAIPASAGVFTRGARMIDRSWRGRDRELGTTAQDFLVRIVFLRA